MTIPNNLFGKKANSTILLIAITSLGLGGNSLYNDTNESSINESLFNEIIQSKILQHEALALPHSPYDVKFDLLDQHMKTDIETSQKILDKIDIMDKTIHEKMDKHQKENRCRDQQLKDLYNKVTISDC